MAEKLEVYRPTNANHQDTPFLQASVFAVQDVTRPLVEIQAKTVGVGALTAATIVPMIGETALQAVTFGRFRGGVGRFYSNQLDGPLRLSDTHRSYYDSYADTNLAKGLVKGFFAGQMDALGGALIGGETGAIVGSVIPVVGTLTGAIAGALSTAAVVEFGVVRGFFDRIGAQMGIKGAMDRLGLRRTVRNQPTQR